MSSDSSLRCFYQNNALHTVTQGEAYHTLLRSEFTPLAEQHPAAPAALLPTDGHGSVLLGLGDGQAGSAHAYAPYGHNPTALSASGLAAFNGERLEPATQLYLLGNYRLYSPRLMRFYSPDNLSPFGKGGLNSYSYCSNDPINYTDSSGQLRLPIIDILSQYKLFKSRTGDTRYLRGLNGEPKKLTPEHRQTLTEETGVINNRISKLKETARKTDITKLQAREAQISSEIDSRVNKIKQIDDQPRSSSSQIMQKRKNDLRAEQIPYRAALLEVQRDIKIHTDIDQLNADLATLNNYLRATT